MKTLYLLCAIICIFLGAFLFSSSVINLTEKLNNKPDIHVCNWEDCDRNGKPNDSKFKSYWGCEEYSDCWCVEYTHYNNPSWTYEQCEDFVFSVENKEE